MSELCEWSDMPADLCQHCKDGKKAVGNQRPRERTARELGEREFEVMTKARNNGTCPLCGDPIYAFETMIVKLDGFWACISCARERVAFRE